MNMLVTTDDLKSLDFYTTSTNTDRTDNYGLFSSNDLYGSIANNDEGLGTYQPTTHTFTLKDYKNKVASREMWNAYGIYGGMGENNDTYYLPTIIRALLLNEEKASNANDTDMYVGYHMGTVTAQIVSISTPDSSDGTGSDGTDGTDNVTGDGTG
jgi:hypothetical protein